MKIINEELDIANVSLTNNLANKDIELTKLENKLNKLKSKISQYDSTPQVSEILGKYD